MTCCQGRIPIPNSDSDSSAESPHWRPRTGFLGPARPTLLRCSDGINFPTTLKDRLARLPEDNGMISTAIYYSYQGSQNLAAIVIK